MTEVSKIGGFGIVSWADVLGSEAIGFVLRGGFFEKWREVLVRAG